MRKIRKFKIPVHHYEIVRKARRYGLDFESQGLSEEQGFREYVSQLAAIMETAVVFDHFQYDDPDMSMLGFKGNSPITAAMLTLGNAFSIKISAENDNVKRLINEISARTFIYDAAKAVADTAGQEAIPEGFVMGSPYFVYSCPEQNHNDGPLFENITQETPLYRDNLIKRLFPRLEAEKIGMEIKDVILFPKISCFFCMEWQRRKKK